MKRDPDEELVGIYNEIDAHLRRSLKQPATTPHKFLITQASRTNAVVARSSEELKIFADLRNMIIHNPYRARIQPFLSPSYRAIERYQAIKQAILNPPSAMTIAVPASKIYTAKLETSLNRVLRDMNQHIFTHVPIIKDNQMIGIFSENVLLSYLADNPDTIILKDMTITDFAAYTPLKAHRGEHFEFLARHASLAEVYEIFNQAIKVKKRVGMVFVTEHGKNTEKPLGIITAWDLASPDFELQ